MFQKSTVTLDEIIDNANQLNTHIESLSTLTLKGLAFELSLEYNFVISDNCYSYMNVSTGLEPYYVSVHEQACKLIYQLFAESRGISLDGDDISELCDQLHDHAIINGYAIDPEYHEEIPVEVL